MAEERVVEETVSFVVAASRLGDDRATVFERIETLPRHRTVTGTAGHGHLDLHTAPLPAVDTERTLVGITGALGEDHDVGDQLG